MFLIVIILLCAVLTLLYWYLTSTFDYWKKKNVVFEKPYIFLGTAARSLQSKQHPAISTQDLYNKYPDEKLIGGFLAKTPELIVKDPDLIKSVLVKDFNHFPDRGFTTDTKREPLLQHLFFVKGDLWRGIRQKLTPTFTSGKMRNMFPLLTEVSRNFKEYLKEITDKSDICEVKELTAKFTTDVIGCCVFGIKMNSLKDENAPFRVMGRKLFEPSAGRPFKLMMTQVFPRLSNLLNIRITSLEEQNFFINLVKSVMESREYEPSTRHDFIDQLIELKTKGSVQGETISNENAKSYNIKITDELLVAQAFVFFAAGFETSSTTMTMTLYELAKNQDVQMKLIEEIDKVLSKHDHKLTYEALLGEMPYLKMVIKETLRLYPPAMFLRRVCTQSCKLSGSEISLDKGVIVTIPLYALHRDPKYFPDPEKYSPDRFTTEAEAARPSYVYMPFGEGPRVCIGVDSVAGMAALAVSAGRSKVLSLLSQKPNRRLILVGHGVGSIFAAQVAVNVGSGVNAGEVGAVGAGVGGVAGVALLAPPLLTWAGPRGLPDDILLDLDCPTLMVVGQNAMQCECPRISVGMHRRLADAARSANHPEAPKGRFHRVLPGLTLLHEGYWMGVDLMEEAEALRSRLRMWSRLVIVGAADDQLRLDFFKCTLEKVTQEMVECALADEVAMFVKSVCQWAECPIPPTPPSAPPTGDHHTHVHNGDENQSRPVNRRRAGGVSGSPPHPKRQKQRRNVGLFKVNNPPADTTTLRMGQYLTIKGDEDTSIVSSSMPVLTQPGKLKGDAFLQITNSHTVRKLGDGTSSPITIPGKPLIKVLENVSIVGAGGRIPTSLSGIKLGTRLSLGSNTPIMDSSSLVSSTPINSTNIMDIPIIFADDNKSLVHLQPSSVIGSTIPIISTSVTQPIMISTISTTPNHTISIKRSTLTPPIKYSKVIVAKRPSATPESPSALTPPVTMTQTVTPTGGTGKVLGRPIIVRGKSGHLTAFRVMPNKTAALVIKRANVISASNMKTLAGLANSKGGAGPAVRDSRDEISNAETEMATREIEKQIEAMTEKVSL